ncbi:hypothetical protein [Embleya sp. AB8]|uniref:hypothetical protein n=1 Tax=Embleya sp. AB8 TaxID=3156304 RepID=UPI003C74440C
MSIKVTVIYRDTAPGVRALADAVAAVAWNTGADIRLRRLPETVGSEQQRDGTAADPPATGGDLSWADVVLLGAPARDGDVVGLLRRLSWSGAPSDEWGCRAEEQVFGVFVTTPEPGTRHGGLMRSFAIVHPPLVGDPEGGPQRSTATLAAEAAPSCGIADPTLLSLDLARIQTRRCVEIAAALREERVVAV